jgi:diaminopimelate decarboxylase
MDAFNYRDGELFAEGVALSAIAERFGTPTYVYSRAHIEAQYLAYADALAGMPHLVCFAVKANSNLGVLNVLARLGAGFDIVSRGELERVLAAGGSADKIVFSGVGKTRDDMRRALEVGVHCFNVESTDELERLQVVAAELGVRAPISLRVNPDVDAGTHPYIPPVSKRTSSASPSPTPKTCTCAPRSCRTWKWSASIATSARN